VSSPASATSPPRSPPGPNTGTTTPSPSSGKPPPRTSSPKCNAAAKPSARSIRRRTTSCLRVPVLGVRRLLGYLFCKRQQELPGCSNWSDCRCLQPSCTSSQSARRSASPFVWNEHGMGPISGLVRPSWGARQMGRTGVSWQRPLGPRGRRTPTAYSTTAAAIAFRRPNNIDTLSR